MNNELAEIDVVIESLPYEEQQIIRAAQDEAKALEMERMVLLRALVQKLNTKRDEAIRAKRPIEESMIRALQVIEGIDNIRDTKANFSSPGIGRTPPVPKLARTRVQRWEARLNEMLVPVQQDAWDLEPDGDPIPQANPETGEAEDVEVAKARVDAKATAMKEQVRDDLSVCNFSRSARRMNRDASRIGTGLLMGPMTTKVKKRRFDEGKMSIEVEESDRPEIREADPRFFFPDPVSRAEKAEFAFYAFMMGEMEVRGLAENPGFDEKQIAKLLKTKPDLGELKVNLTQWNSDLDRAESFAGKYAIWRYTGVLNREELKALDICECEDEESIPDMAMADIWHSGEFILMAKLSPIENDFRIPYFVFAPFQRDDSMFGVPLAQMCEGSNRSAVAAWRMVLINGSVSSAPTIIRRLGAVEPADKQHQQYGPKLFNVTDPTVDINDVMAVINIPNTVEQAMTIFDRSIALMDEELNTAQWGDASTNEEIQTASGLAMTLNVRSIIQANVAAAADDEVFRPAVERMVWWNNIFSDKDDIKGNYVVLPLIQSVRLVKDTQAQHLQVLMTLTDNPKYEGMTDNYDMLTEYSKLIDVPPGSFFVGKETYLANQANKQDPNQALNDANTLLVQAKAELAQAQAEAAPIRAQADAMLAQAKQANDEARLQLDAMKAQQEANDATQQLAVQLKALQDKMDMFAMEMQGATYRTEQERINAAELGVAELSQRSAEVDAELTMKGMELTRDANEMALKLQTGSGI